jgi:hypothetical protein
MSQDKLERGFGGGLQAIDFSDVAHQIEQASGMFSKQGCILLQ